MAFAKFYCENNAGQQTAGLILTTETAGKMSPVQFANFYPHSEALKLGTVYRSKWYETWDEAFAHSPTREDIRVARVNNF